VIAYLLRELLANWVRTYGARLRQADTPILAPRPQRARAHVRPSDLIGVASL
jgi:hypothetical protein